MKLSNVTWIGPKIDDVEVFGSLPDELRVLLRKHNGFILNDGAVHIRGSCHEPSWHSLRSAWQGHRSFWRLYPLIEKTDIPFAQDQVGDQYLIRNSKIIHLNAETGDICEFATSLQEFFSEIELNIEEFLNVNLQLQLKPGQLLHAYPPFCVNEANKGVSLKACTAESVILFHAEFAKQIKNIPDGRKIKINITD